MEPLAAQIRQNILSVTERIRSAAQLSSREEGSVRLVVVTKSQPVDVIRGAVEAGAKVLGENYPEETLPKMQALSDIVGIEWHMIGHVQSRKARLVAEHFNLIHSLDSLRLAERLDRFAGELGRSLPVLLEFNVGGNLQTILNTEIEFPIFEKVGIKGVVFFDAGNAWNTEGRYCGRVPGSAASSTLDKSQDPCVKFALDGLRTSVGFGFRWFSPIGPLRFEWGIPLRRLPGEDSIVFENVNIGRHCKIRRAIIESGGFSEYADQGRDLEKEVLDIARRWDMRVVGPNCISIVNLENGLVLPFVPLEDREVRKGNISIVAQSGGIALDCMRLLSYENLGASKLISMGNKLDVNENDFFEFLRSDPDTRVIGFYLEDVADGGRLMRLAAQTEKPLIVLKANTNPASNHAARFHTAALAGDDEVVTAAFRQAGIHRVQNLTEMMESFKVFSLPVIKGPRLAVLGRSGGQAVLLADAVHRYGFELAKLSDDFFSHVRQHIRAGVIRMSNPLDMGDIFNIDAYAGIVEKALAEDGVDGVVISHAYVANLEVAPSKRLLEASLDLSRRYGKPVIPCIIPDKHTWFSVKEEADAFLFEDVDTALKALSRSLWHHRFQAGRRAAGTKLAVLTVSMAECQ